MWWFIEPAAVECDNGSVNSPPPADGLESALKGVLWLAGAARESFFVCFFAFVLWQEGFWFEGLEVWRLRVRGSLAGAPTVGGSFSLYFCIVLLGNADFAWGVEGRTSWSQVGEDRRGSGCGCGCGCWSSLVVPRLPAAPHWGTLVHLEILKVIFFFFFLFFLYSWPNSFCVPKHACSCK